MDYKLDRIRGLAEKDIKPASDAIAFVAIVQAVASGEIVQSSDRIRFTESNKVFRFASDNAAERMIDMIEQYFENRSPCPRITRQS